MILSPREIVPDRLFHCPDICIKQCIEGLISGSNNAEKIGSIDDLYFGRDDNGSGHLVLKIDTRTIVSVNQVKAIPHSLLLLIKSIQ